MDLSGWVGVGLGGNCVCRRSIIYAPTLGGGFAGLVSLRSSPYSSDFLFLAGFGLPPEFCYECVGLAHLLFYGTLYKTLLARKLSKPEDGCYKPKHVVLHC